jgi:predicted nucleotidyltransferase
MQIEVNERELATIRCALSLYEGLLRTEESGANLVRALIDSSGQLRDRWLLRAVATKEVPFGGVSMSSATSLWEPLDGEEVHNLAVRLNTVESLS